MAPAGFGGAAFVGGEAPDPLRTKDVAAIWDHVVGQARAQGRGGPEVFYIGLTRFLMGPNREANAATKVALERIDGDIVAGNAEVTGGQQLVDYITNVYHLPLMKGPARYTVQWFYKSGQGEQVSAPMGEIILQAPDEIQRSRRAREEWAQQNQPMPTMGAGGYPMPPRRAAGAGGYPQWPGYPQPPTWPQPPGYPPPSPPQPPPGAQPLPPVPLPPPGASPEMVQQLIDAAQYRGMYNERLLADQRAAAQQPQVPAADTQAAQTAAIVARTLSAMGFTPELAAKLNAPPPVPALNAGHAQSLSDPLDALTSALSTLSKYEKIREGLRGFNPKDEGDDAAEEVVAEVELKSNPMVATALGISDFKAVPKNEDEKIIEYAVRWANHNPEAAQKIMATAMEKLSTFGPLIDRMMKSRHPAVQEAAQEVRRGFVNQTEEVPAAPPTPPGRGWAPTA